MTDCISCGEPTPIDDTAPGQVGDCCGALCANCAYWCDGNIVAD